MNQPPTDMETLLQAVEALNRTTHAWEAAYRGLQEQLLQLDRELAEKNRDLALTTDYLSSLLESVSDGVIAINPEGIVTRFNRAAAQILGHARQEVEGHSFAQVFGREFAAPALPSAMLLRAKSGRATPISERDSTVSDASGRQWGQVKSFQDLSEVTALREQVRQLDRLAAIGEMAATVAHEIRNPLGGIRGFALFLAQDLAESDPNRRWVDKILAGASSLDKIISELLEYTRPVSLTLRPTSCADMVASALSFLTYDPNRIAIDANLPPPLKILADPGMMRQVFLNILLNAAQSIEGPGRIAIEAHDCGNQVQLTVRDTGCGMTPEQLEKLCSPFFTTKEKGTGLGMALCQKIIDGHGGRLSAESHPGQGTAVHMVLPKAE